MDGARLRERENMKMCVLGASSLVHRECEEERGSARLSRKEGLTLGRHA